MYERECEPLSAAKVYAGPLVCIAGRVMNMAKAHNKIGPTLVADA